ncbi:DUF2285 domain-containing protein [Rhizobium pusense]|uniref:DUF2285 domain-containing protein n=1 Tax=Agrobacterium pusense TaxID=648995 RepID=UPI002447449F|nr:DUF2285 domain-containing protein [Agrobacterium pusense]MDH1270522.1 DUF2285 domain-containing protein [Agrobacterium pusense]
MTEEFLESPPACDQFTDYDRINIKLYIRLLDAEADGADWIEAVKVLFGIDPVVDPARAKRIHDSHLARAHWMTTTGYKHLLRQSKN